MYKATKIRTFPNVAAIERNIVTAAKMLPIPVGNLTDSLINRYKESFTPCSFSMFWGILRATPPCSGAGAIVLLIRLSETF